VIELSTYTFETLRRDNEFLFYRGRRECDGSRLLLVELLSERPSARSLKQLEHEYSIKEELDPEWAARPIELQRRDGRTMLLLEDPGGEPLNSLLGRPLELTEFLPLAIGLAGSLAKLHAVGFIHKNIKPANVLAESATGKVWLTGFGITSRLRSERQAPERLESLPTLAYLAPEQTGRMNRSIDSRSDLYSFGAILYEMLTGVLPFTVSEPMEWVHAHIARRPIPPREREAHVPETVSAIVVKLLAKASEERYQTAAGVEADLRTCLAQMVALNRIDPFPLGAHDMSDRLRIPERLYGRDRECAELRYAFERVVSSGRPEVALVSGYSGVGKSSIVNELQKAIVLGGGIFISGKFDQYKRDIPFATIGQAFQSLVRQVLARSDEEVEGWRNSIQQAAGRDGQILIDLIPELELIIGQQPSVPDLPPDKARNRIHAVFQRFLAACAQDEHPLSLFIDDLQWLDTATIELLEHLVTDVALRYFLLVGAYRDNEVTPSHPVMLMLDSIRQTGTKMSEIVVKPLSPTDISRLLSDALHRDQTGVQPLAQLVNEKTAGNPFFAIQFLSSLADEHLLEFDNLKRVWRWDLDRIREKGFTENVVDLMVAKLRRLPLATQEGLKRLACLGISARTVILTVVHEGSQEELHSDLWEAVQMGFVLRLEGSYKFSHDRIQEAAYTLIPEEARAEFHLRIGRLLLSSMPPEVVAKNIFSLVNQFNAGSALVKQQKEKERLAELNLTAGRKAKASAAYASTCTYLSAGMTLIGRSGWKRCYDLALNLWLERAECEFLTGNFEAAEQLISEVLRQGRSKLDKSAAYRLRLQLCVMKTQNTEAVGIALECLGLFGIEIPAHPTHAQVQSEYEEVWQNLAGRSIASLLELPRMNDPEMHAAMNVLSALFVPALSTDNNLLRLLFCRMVNVSLKYGTTDASTYGYAWFGLLLGPVFHRYKDAYQFGQLAVDLVEKYNFLAWKAKVFYVMEMVLLWTRPLKTAQEYTRAAFRSGVEIGDLTCACYGSEHGVTDLLLQGEHLDQVWLESVKAKDFALRAKYQDVADVLLSIQRFVQHLRGQTAGLSTFEVTDEQTFEAQLTENRYATKICWYWILKLRIRFLFGDYPAALAAAKQAKVLLWASECHIQLLDYCFYTALANAALEKEAAPDGKFESLPLLIEHLAQLKEWAESCPSTFRDKYSLAAAELARLEARDLDAMRLYEDAIQTAHENGFVHNEGIAFELAAVFYLKRGFERIGNSYIRNARNCYLRWGALAKAKQLDELYPSQEEQAPDRLAETGAAPANQFDLVAVANASQAVSGAIVLDRLIEILMVIAVEQAGAERGLLILLRNGKSQIEAEAITGSDKVEVHLGQERITGLAIPESILQYVLRTGQKVILDDASVQNLYSHDADVQRRRLRSILCLPITKQGELMGVLYLENNFASGAFTQEKQAVLELLASQAAISLDNARLYSDLRQEIADRKMAEEALRASEDRWRRLFEYSSVGITVKDLDQRIVAANPAFQKMLGYTQEELQILPPVDIAPEGGRAVGQMIVADLKDGWRQSDHQEKRYRRKDGSVLWADVSAFFVPATESTPGFFPTIAVDITERKRTEEALNRLNQALQTVYQCNHALVHAADEQELLHSVCQILVEVGGLRMAWVGFCEDDPEKTVRPVGKAGYGGDYLERTKLSWSDREEGRGPTGIAIRTGKPCWVRDTRTDPIFAPWRELAVSRGYLSAVALPLLAQGKSLGVLNLYAAEPNAFNESTIEQYRDLANNLVYGITALRTREEREHAEEALRESEQRLQDIVDNTTAVVFVKDLDLRYVLVNREYERRHSVQREEIRGKTDLDIHPQPFAEAVRANDRRVMEAGVPIQFEQTVPTAGGECHYVVVKFLLRDNTGKPYAICGIGTDITELKRAAEKIREDAGKLFQANEVLERSLKGLARDKNLHRFVDQVLVALTEQLGAHSLTLWLIDIEQRRGYLQLVCQDGRAVAAEHSDHPNAREPHQWSSDDPGWIALQMKRAFYYYDATNSVHTLAQRAHFLAIGVQSVFWIPLLFGEQLIGMLSVRFAVNHRMGDEGLEFAQALAQQVTLALELERLAEQTKQSALAVEKEIAARESAAQLAKANEALLQSLDALAAVPELDEFLGQVMVATTRQLSAASSALFLRQGEDCFLKLDLVFQDGRVLTPRQSKYPEELQTIPLDERALGLLKTPAAIVHLVSDRTSSRVVNRSYLLGIGVKTLLIIPLVISRHLIGSLNFRFTEDREFRPEEIEIARALAIQASLAIQLTRLAKAARQSAVLTERNQLVGEIHDSLAQFFTGISMQLGAAREVAKAESGSVLRYVERATDMAQFGLAEARRSAFSLQPTIIEESGLIEALQRMVERSNIPGRLRCNFHSTGVPEESLPSSVQQELLRIAQEAMSNALRHAKPTVVSVHLRCNPPNLLLEVIDNGSGIDDSQAASREGFGFSSMRARARNIGAQLEVRTAGGRGTTIAVRVPMNF
jgi:PAS domain S-box-containing protein